MPLNISYDQTQPLWFVTDTIFKNRFHICIDNTYINLFLKLYKN